MIEETTIAGLGAYCGIKFKPNPKIIRKSSGRIIWERLKIEVFSKRNALASCLIKGRYGNAEFEVEREPNKLIGA